MVNFLNWANNKLSDWHNVKTDFSAVGDGVADDTSTIQSAINWVTSTSARGTIYFPPGTYKVTSPLNLPLGLGYVSLCLIGDGSASTITGNVNGFIIERYDPTYQDSFSNIITLEQLKIINTYSTPNSDSGAIRLGTTQFTSVRDCTISGVLALVYNENELYRDTGQCGPSPGSNAAPNCSSFPFQVMNCKITPISGSIISGSVGIATGNQGAIVNCDIDGYDKGINLIGSGSYIMGGQIVNCNTGIVAGFDQFGQKWGGGFAIRGTQFNNNSIAGFSVSGGCVASGVIVIGNGGQYGIYTAGGGGTEQSVFTSCIASGNFSIASIAIDDSPAQHAQGTLYNTFIGSSASNSGSGVTWLMPYNATSAQFINCDCPAAQYTFTTLPDLSAGTAPVIGDEYLITDSPTTTTGHFATVVSVGNSSNPVKLRWNGTEWIII